MKRASGWRRSPGWVRQGVGTAVLVGGFFVALAFTIGPALAAVNPALDRVAAWIGGSS